MLTPNWHLCNRIGACVSVVCVCVQRSTSPLNTDPFYSRAMRIRKSIILSSGNRFREYVGKWKEAGFRSKIQFLLFQITWKISRKSFTFRFSPMRCIWVWVLSGGCHWLVVTPFKCLFLIWKKRPNRSAFIWINWSFAYLIACNYCMAIFEEHDDEPHIWRVHMAQSTANSNQSHSFTND